MNLSKKIKVAHEVADNIWNTAKRLYGDDLPDFTITFYKKGKAAGRARKTVKRGNGLHVEETYFLELNLDALDRFFNNTIEETIPHELAHIVCFAKPSLGKNHDKGWKRVCINLGGSGKRCHTMDLVPARKTKRYEYVTECGTRKVVLTAIRHNKLQSGKVPSYRLKKTGGRITKHGLQRVVEAV